MPAPDNGTNFALNNTFESASSLGNVSTLTFTCGNTHPVKHTLVAFIWSINDHSAEPTITTVVDSKGNLWEEVPDSDVSVGSAQGPGTGFITYGLRYWMAYVDTALVPGDTITVDFANTTADNAAVGGRIEDYSGLLKGAVDLGGNIYQWQDDASDITDPTTSACYTGAILSAEELRGVKPHFTSPDEQFFYVALIQDYYYQFNTADNWLTGTNNTQFIANNAQVGSSGINMALAPISGISTPNGGNRFNIWERMPSRLLHGNGVTSTFDPGMQQTSSLPAVVLNTYKGGNWRAFQTTMYDPLEYRMDNMYFRVT